MKLGRVKSYSELLIVGASLAAGGVAYAAAQTEQPIIAADIPAEAAAKIIAEHLDTTPGMWEIRMDANDYTIELLPGDNAQTRRSIENIRQTILASPSMHRAFKVCLKPRTADSAAGPSLFATSMPANCTATTFRFDHGQVDALYVCPAAGPAPALTIEQHAFYGSTTVTGQMNMHSKERSFDAEREKILSMKVDMKQIGPCS